MRTEPFRDCFGRNNLSNAGFREEESADGCTISGVAVRINQVRDIDRLECADRKPGVQHRESMQQLKAIALGRSYRCRLGERDQSRSRSLRGGAMADRLMFKADSCAASAGCPSAAVIVLTSLALLAFGNRHRRRTGSLPLCEDAGALP